MWKLLKTTVLSFIEDEALSRGAAIAFYTVTSLAPILLIVIAIAGLAFGQEAAQNAITAQLSGLMGQQTADVLQSAVASASSKSSGILATLIGIATLLVTASGVFGEMQTALNKIWDAEPQTSTVSRLIRARAASLGLVAALGFLLLVSLVISAVLSGLGDYLNALLPFGGVILSILNFVVSLALISVLFAAIYKVLPDRPIAWRDVIAGAIVTALLFTVGKSLIGWYLGSSAIASSYGAAGGLIILLLWVYYSTQTFLLGAEFTRVYASYRRGEDPALVLQKVPTADAGSGTKEGHTSSYAQHNFTFVETGESKMIETTGKAPSLGELERDSTRNREALASSIDALQRRASPSAIKHDVQNYVQTKKNGILEGLEQRAKENPLQAIAIAAGVAYPLWSLVRRIPVPILLIGAGVALSGRPNNHSDRGSANGPSLLDSARDRLEEFTEATIDRASDVAELVQKKASLGLDAARGAAGRLSRLGSEASEQAVDLAARVGDRLTETGGTAQRMSGEAFARAGESFSPDRIRSAASEVNDWIQDTVSRHPLLVGAAGIGIGAIIAAALPKSPQEDSILGSAAEQVKRRARDAAAAGVHTATGVATDIYREAMAEAENQGLSADGLKDAVAEVSAEARATAAAALNGPGEARDLDTPSYQTSGFEKGFTT